MRRYDPADGGPDAEAADWLVRLADEDAGAEDPDLHGAFLAWLTQSPRHVKAFLEASEAFRSLDGLDPQRRIDVRRLVEGQGADVIPLREGAELGRQEPAAAPTAMTTGRRASFRRRVAMSVAATVAVCTVLLAWSLLTPSTYRTAVGEQRTFKLDDGSMLYLNTQSEVQVQFSSHLREVRLLEGEGLFAVEHDPDRPFVVSTEGATIRALGTRFNVYERGASTKVSVVEGLVQVAAAQGSMRLAAGEEADIVDGRVAKAHPVEPADVVAWRERRLVFREAPLGAVAAEFNRYNKKQIRLQGDGVRDLQLTGVFSADHPQSVVLYLTKDPTLEVEEGGDAWVIRRR